MTDQKKLNISVLCGGQSAEHEISLLSARNVVQALDADRYVISVVYIDRQGGWYTLPSHLLLDLAQHQQHRSWPAQADVVALDLRPGQPSTPWQCRGELSPCAVDCVIPMVHGRFGEDGNLQGLLSLLNVPYVGADALASADAMNKIVTKTLLRAAGLPTPDWLGLSAQDLDNVGQTYQQVTRQLGGIVFVKPASQGSSVGIHKVTEQQEFATALADALQYDTSVIVESAISGREIECAVLGNTHPIASLPGEITTTHDFYSYEAKYLDPEGYGLEIPAVLEPEVVKQIQSLAVQAFTALQCAGMARVDFFLPPDGQLLINEVNTIPGFTDISMYAKCWQASGLAMNDLLDRLITLALERHQQQQQLSLYPSLDLSLDLSSNLKNVS